MASSSSEIFERSYTSCKLYTGQAPFFGVPVFRIVSAVIRGERPAKPSFFDGQLMSEQVWAVVTQCWTQQPADRPSAEQVVRLLADLPKPTVPRQLRRSTTAGKH